MAARACSVSVSGGATSRAGCVRSNETAGSAWRSTFPLAVRGSLSISTNAEGIMYCGNRACRYLRSDAGVRTAPSAGSSARAYASGGWCRISRPPSGEGLIAYT